MKRFFNYYRQIDKATIQLFVMTQRHIHVGKWLEKTLCVENVP